MTTIPADLAALLSTVRRPGDFFAAGTAELLAPLLEVEGVGPVALPLLPTQAGQLAAVAKPAPYGRGAETLVDPAVRHCRQIGPDQVRIRGRHWARTLEAIVHKGTHPSAQVLKARILLKADMSEAGESWSDERIVAAFDTSLATVHRTRQRLVEKGFDAVLQRKQRERPSIARIFDGEKEARLITLACSEPPPGHAKWSLRLLEEKVVELGIVERASDNTIGRTLKKTFSNRT